MFIYIPYYDRGWHIQKAEAEKVKKFGNGDSWMYCGTIYGNHAYTTETAAQAYINKDYTTTIKGEFTK